MSEASTVTPEQQAPAAVRSRDGLSGVLLTQEAANKIWTEYKEAVDSCPALRRYVVLWNRRANILRNLQAISDELAHAASLVPEEHKKHL